MRGLISSFALLALSPIVYGCKARTQDASHARSVTTQGFSYESVKVKVMSSDNKPVKGVGVSYAFTGKKFYFSNPNTITPFDVSPGIYETLEKSGLLGTTGENGVFSVDNVKIELDDDSNKTPAQLKVSVENGGDSELCPGTSRRMYLAWGSAYLLPRSSDEHGGPVYCNRVASARDSNDPESFELNCILDNTLAQFTERKAAAFKRTCESSR